MTGGALLALVVVSWVFLARTGTPVVHTAVARAATDAPSEGSVLDASGYVTARRQATVSAKITGKVTEVLIEEGMRVEEGAVLARLDATEAQAQLGLANAQLVAARSQTAEVRAQLDQAERDFVRQQALWQTAVQGAVQGRTSDFGAHEDGLSRGGDLTCERMPRRPTSRCGLPVVRG